MAMAGGDLSAVLVDLTGLHFGRALMSALGVPEKTPVQCFVGDLEMRRGLLDFRAMTLDTGEAITNVGGNLDLSKETIDLALKTRRETFHRRIAAHTHKHQRNFQGPEEFGPGRRCRKDGGRCRIGRIICTPGDPANYPVR